MTVQRRSASAGGSVRRYLSEADEKEALKTLRDQLRRQKRVTSDDVRQTVRAIASKGGSVALPPDFPPSRWVLDFKRVHGFVQFNSFAFGSEAFALPERIEPRPLMKTKSTERSLSSGVSSDDEKEKEPSESSYGTLDSTPSTFEMQTQNHTKMQAQMHARLEIELQHNFEQRHRRYQQQHQQRLKVMEDRRGRALLGRFDEEELRSNTSSLSLDSASGTTTGASNNSVTGPGNGVASPAGNQADETTSNMSVSSEKRGYKQSHTVPAETWEKAIAAVEQQGMSLRVAAKMYGVHFAALHRRVKKRAQSGLSLNGHNGYFHPNDEAGIVRVVVARAELGVLMTFNELMVLVEASALRKLPDISVDAARVLLDRFQSRNENSIRHLVDDWPPPRPSGPTNTTLRPSAQQPSFHRGYVLQVGRDASRHRPVVSTGTGGAATAAAVAAAVPSSGLFVPPARVAASIGAESDGARTRASKFVVPDGKTAAERGRSPTISVLEA